MSKTPANIKTALLIAIFNPRMSWDTIPEEEEPQIEEQPDPANQDTLVFTSKEEPFNTATDTTSDDSIIVNQLQLPSSPIKYEFQLKREVASK